MTDKIKIRTTGCVYHPEEDSVLLAKAVERYAFGRVLDIGTGSGVQGIVAAKMGCDVTFSDIDSEAVWCAKANAGENGVEGRFVVSDLFEKISGRFDTIIFNPPYLPSGEAEVKALDGGKDGREVIDRFISEYKDHVEGKHMVLLLESSFNNYERDVERLKAVVVEKGHYFFEDLAVLRF